MVMEGNKLSFVETRLTKGHVAKPKAGTYTDNISLLTGEKGESKTKSYIDLESKKVAIHYVSTNSTLNDKLENNEQKGTDLQARL